MSLDLRAALAPIDQQFLSELKTEGWTDTEIRNLGRAWAIAKEDIDAVTGSEHADPRAAEIRIAKIAAQINHAINVRMQASTPAFHSATPEQLLEWIDFYHSEADRLYNVAIDAQLNHPEGKAHGNPAFDEAFAQFHRICGFLWEAQEVAGVNKLMQTQVVA